jgi:hypothetical protein
MNQLVSQLPLNTRIPALRDSILSTRVMKEQCQREEAELMAELAQAEAEAASGDEGIPLSGLIPEGENPYASHSASGSAPDAPQDAPEPSFLEETAEAPAPRGRSRR